MRGLLVITTFFQQLEIKNHVFFSPINWDDLYHKRLTPPFNPNVVRHHSLCTRFWISGAGGSLEGIWANSLSTGGKTKGHMVSWRQNGI